MEALCPSALRPGPCQGRWSQRCVMSGQVFAKASPRDGGSISSPVLPLYLSALILPTK